MEPRRHHRAQRHARGSAGVNDRIAAREGHLQRLLDDDMLAAARSRDSRLQVGAAWRADRDHCHVRVGEHHLDVGVGRAAVGGAEALGGGGDGVEAGDEAGVRQLSDGGLVEARDHAAADDAEAVAVLGGSSGGAAAAAAGGAGAGGAGGEVRFQDTEALHGH